MIFNFTGNSSNTESPKKKQINWALLVIAIILLLLLAWGIFRYVENKNLKASLQAGIQTEAQNYADPVLAAQYLNDTVNEMLDNEAELKLAKDYAAANNIDYPTAILDMAVSKAKKLGFLNS